MDIERSLRASLSAREPGAQFEDAVMAKVRAAGQAAAAPRSMRTWRIPAALAATVLAVAVGLHWYAEEQRAARNHDQLLLALAITGYELDRVREKLGRTSEIVIEENGT